MRLIARTISLASISMLALITVTASAQQVAFTDMGPGNSFDTTAGWAQDGPTDPSTVKYNVGMEFTSLATGRLGSIDIALSGIGVDSSLPENIYLTSSLPTSPSNITNVLESYTVTYLPYSTSNLVTLTSQSNPTLTQGDTYYLTAVPTGSAASGWSWNNQGVTGNITVSSSGGNFVVKSGSTLGAFSVYLSPPAVPEASSFASIAFMGLGSTMLLRRKRKA